MNTIVNSLNTATDCSLFNYATTENEKELEFGNPSNSQINRYLLLSFALGVTSFAIGVNTSPVHIKGYYSSETLDYNVCNICREDSLSQNIWVKINSFKSQNEEHKSLIYLFNELHRNLNNVDLCNNFLIYSSRLHLTNNEIVHILNSLSPIKDQLKQWNIFVTYSKDLITQRKDSKYADKLLKVVL